MKHDAIIYLNVETALAIHKEALERFGGAPGIRDNDLLESAIVLHYIHKLKNIINYLHRTLNP